MAWKNGCGLGLQQIDVLRRQLVGRLAMQRGHDLLADQRRRDRHAVAMPARVGAHRAHLAFRGGVIPEEIDRPLPGHHFALAAGHRIGHRRAAVRHAEGIAVVEPRPGLLDQRAPRDVAGIARLHLRQQRLAHGGAMAVGADQQIGRGGGAVRERRDDAVVRRLQSGEGLALMVLPVRQASPQRAPDRGPRALALLKRNFLHDRAGPLEADPGRHLDAGLLVDHDADAPHDVEQVLVRAEAGAAGGQIAGDALVHRDIPADRLEAMRREQSAHGAADDHRLLAQCACSGVRALF